MNDNQYQNSIENDLNQHQDRLDFLNDYQLGRIIYDSSEARLYQLNSPQKEDALLIVEKKVSNRATDTTTWVTPDYRYQILRREY